MHNDRIARLLPLLVRMIPWVFCVQQTSSAFWCLSSLQDDKDEEWLHLNHPSISLDADVASFSINAQPCCAHTHSTLQLWVNLCDIHT